MISEARERLIARGNELVGALQEYEAHHPGRGTDADGRAYAPESDVILAADPPVDAARSAAIDRRCWEGFAWASCRYVLSDSLGDHVIVGYNEDAGRWFLDTSSPVALPDERVDELVGEAGLDVSGYEDPRTLHAALAARWGRDVPTVPSLTEVDRYLTRFRRGDARVPTDG